MVALCEWDNDCGRYKQEDNAMRISPLVLTLLIGFGLGAATTQGLKAQAKPPAYVISEIELTNPDAYGKEYVPLANKALAASGQKRLASGGKTISLAGAAPAARVVVSMFESLEAAQQAYTSPAYLEARKVGDKYAKLRIFAVEGAAQ
jgi:uncharacterized protein (DUF1330 family)